MSTIRLGDLGRRWSGSAYNVSDHYLKQTFHRVALRRMRKLATLMGLPPGTYDVRSNKAGIAVSGEVTLHGEGIYVQASMSGFGREAASILVRSCKGRKDYCGGTNQFVRGWDALDDFDHAWAQRTPIGCLDALAAFCKHVMDNGR